MIRILQGYGVRVQDRLLKRENVVSSGCFQTINTIFVTIIIVLFACTGAVPGPIIKYSDEVFALYALWQIFLHFGKIMVNKNYYKLFRITVFTLVIIVIWGLISNVYAGVLMEPFPILIDLFSMIKAPVVFIFVLAILQDWEKKIIINNLIPLAQTFVVICFLCSVLNLFIDINMDYEIRYGFRCFRFVYRNPGSLAVVLFCIHILLCFKGGRLNSFLGGCGLVSIFLTFRAVALAALVFLIFFKCYARFKKSEKKAKFKPTILIPLGIVAIVVGWNQINRYLLSGDTARSVLIKGAFYVLQTYFPFGSGFATYGSSQAYEVYSSLYYQLGFDSVYGLSPKFGDFANDNFWPMMIGQFSIVGTLAYLYLLYSQVQLACSINGRKKWLSIIPLLAYVFINSIAAAVYTACFGVLVYTFTALYIYHTDFQKKN